MYICIQYTFKSLGVKAYLFGVVELLFPGSAAVIPLLGLNITNSVCTTGWTIASLAFSLASSYSFFDSSTRFSKSSVII